MVLNIILNWLISGLILWVVAYLLPGIHLNGLGTALFATFILGILNTLILPILTLITLPINFLTLGLFSFILNALMFALCARLVPGFEVSHFGYALLGSLLLAILSSIVTQFKNRNTSLKTN